MTSIYLRYSIVSNKGICYEDINGIHRTFNEIYRGLQGHKWDIWVESF